MRALELLVGVLLATVLHVLGGRLVAEFPSWVDLFLVVAVYTSLDSAPVASMLRGTVAGLVHDALTGGLYGLHGFADTVVAWIVARMRQRLVIQQPLQVGLLFVLAAALQQALLAALRLVMVPGSELPGTSATVAKVVASGILGAGLFVLTARWRAFLAKWRDQRRRRLRVEVR